MRTKTLLQNRIDPKIKQQFSRYSKLVDIPMNRLIEDFIVKGMETGKLGLKQRLWNDLSTDKNMVDVWNSRIL